MPFPSLDQTEAKVIELCSEDDYGSWELWWHVSAGTPCNELPQLKQHLVNILTNLVASRKLISKRQNTDGGFVATRYDQAKLSRELDFAHDPDPSSYFWFGTE